MTTKTEEILDRARELDKLYEECVDAVRFYRREAYLARTGSRYVKRSQLDAILNTIDNLKTREEEIVDEISKLREKSGLSWGDFLEALAEDGDR